MPITTPDTPPSRAPRHDDRLHDLALARSGIDRVAHERAGASILDDLLGDPATRVVELRGEHLPVQTASPGRPSSAPAPRTIWRCTSGPRLMPTGPGWGCTSAADPTARHTSAW